MMIFPASDVYIIFKLLLPKGDFLKTHNHIRHKRETHNATRTPQSCTPSSPSCARDSGHDGRLVCPASPVPPVADDDGPARLHIVRRQLDRVRYSRYTTGHDVLVPADFGVVQLELCLIQ
eukprot:943424-Pyramimonas_sp.AAC.1